MRVSRRPLMATWTKVRWLSARAKLARDPRLVLDSGVDEPAPRLPTVSCDCCESSFAVILRRFLMPRSLAMSCLDTSVDRTFGAVQDASEIGTS